VRLETVLTRIDAAFAGDALPQQLRILRASIKSVLDAPQAADTPIATPAEPEPPADETPPVAQAQPQPARMSITVSGAPSSLRPWGKPPGGAD
jgi:hypothetical protein